MKPRLACDVRRRGRDRPPTSAPEIEVREDSPPRYFAPITRRPGELVSTTCTRSLAIKCDTRYFNFKMARHAADLFRYAASA